MSEKLSESRGAKRNTKGQRIEKDFEQKLRKSE